MFIAIICGIIIILFVILTIKSRIWDEPQNEIKRLSEQLKSQEEQLSDVLTQYNTLLAEHKPDELERLRKKVELFEAGSSNLTAIPYMAKIMADYETYGIEHLALCLNWGHDVKRLKKVKSIQEIRKDAQSIVEKYINSEYQLAYLLELYPNLSDVIDSEFSQLPPVKIDALSEYDRARDYISKEEYSSLTPAERNQLALDRYVESKSKTKWQIGRDYELSIGYQYEVYGHSVEYYGSNMGLEDLGRDLLVRTKRGMTFIIQCKYWSEKKLIHEKHITQLYGTVASYCIEHNVPSDRVKGILITNITLSDMAKKMADYLGVDYRENIPFVDYPRIKCNIGRDEFGLQTKIYHLPFDQQYDKVKLDKPGEMKVFTVEEAEKNGFRRAFKWNGI